PLEALMGLVVSTLKYALIPPATLEEETVKAYGPGSAAAVPATFQNVAVVTVLPLLVLTIDVQPEGAVIVGVPEPVRDVIEATMTSLAIVSAGRLMASVVVMMELQLLERLVRRNPITIVLSHD